MLFIAYATAQNLLRKHVLRRSTCDYLRLRIRESDVWSKETAFIRVVDRLVLKHSYDLIRVYRGHVSRLACVSYLIPIS